MGQQAGVENLETVESVWAIHGERAVRDDNVLTVCRKVSGADVGVASEGNGRRRDSVCK